MTRRLSPTAEGRCIASPPRSWRRVALLAIGLGLSATIAAPSAHAQQPRVLFVPGGSVPPGLRRTLSRTLAQGAELADYNAYVRATAARRWRPSSRTALRRVATQQGVNVIVVAGYGGHYRRRTLRMRYIDGQSGDLIASSTYVLRGQHLRSGSQRAILRELAEASGSAPPPEAGTPTETPPDAPPDVEPDPPAAAGGEPAVGADGLPPPLDWDAEEPAATSTAEPAAPAVTEAPLEAEPTEGDGEPTPLAEQSQWGFALGLGAGVANRTSDIPTTLGAPATLSTLPYPAIQAEILGYVRPDATTRHRVELALRYTTSVGLLAQDQRADGTTRTTDLRSHHLRIGLGTRIPLAPGPRPTFLFLELGWGFRMLDAEIPVSIPDYTLTGISARIGLFFSIGDSPISVGLIPEIAHAGNLSDDLGQLAEVSDGFIVGAEAVVRIQIIDEVAVLVMYREAHAFLGSALGGELHDAERYGVLRAEYSF